MRDMARGAYGILEPVSIKKAEVSDIDLIIVPGIAFDINGGRCGFGKGYYDRLLCESKAKKIGLCYDFQLVREIETDEHDIPMDMIITERRIINHVV
jgi:5-formyltetrahydrofolate cyclo-ligase